MSFVADLQAIHEFDSGYSVRAVAWLANTEPYRTGPVPTEFLDLLHQHIEKAWQPILSGGWHECELCKKGFLRQPFCSSSNLFIPSTSVLYFAPVMIEHYIRKHHYQPPQEFIEAVLLSPAQKTPEYFQAIRPFAERWHVLSNGLRE